MMIATIQGEVTVVGADQLILRVNGIGFRVFVPAAICSSARLGDHCELQTYLVVREDALTLFGFEREEERHFFELLLGVNGVGPRTALAILSTLSVDAIRRAVLSEQADVFARVSGVGRKTAQKILLQLQGKVGTEVAGVAGVPVLDMDTDVIDALTSLGYSVVEAQAALQTIPRDAPRDVETRLRLALQYFSS
jgi:Holliday junction DNA helicase RuvA